MNVEFQSSQNQLKFTFVDKDLNPPMEYFECLSEFIDNIPSSNFMNLIDEMNKHGFKSVGPSLYISKLLLTPYNGTIYAKNKPY